VAFKLAPKRAGKTPDILHFSDIRKFGRLWLIPVSKLATLAELKDLGPEPLSKDFSPERFVQCLRRYNGMVKPIMLKQTCVAGIGNIYADESLFDAGIHPTTRIERLKDAELRTLGRMVISNLTDAVGHQGSSVGEYVGMRGQLGKHGLYLRVYGRGGEPCKSRRTGQHCRGTIKRIVVAQRGTHICPVCQKVRA
jgi:formamidopyrimidine-DNA glycosylase